MELYVSWEKITLTRADRLTVLPFSNGLKKRIFTREVESESQISNRLSSDEKKALSGVAWLPWSSRANTTKKEYQKTMTEQQKYLERVTEPFDGLNQRHMWAVCQMAKALQKENRDLNIEKI